MSDGLTPLSATGAIADVFVKASLRFRISMLVRAWYTGVWSR